MKDWSIVIIVLLIIGIVLDGLRRMRQARRESIALSKNAEKADLGADASVSSSEFPSGGARVAGYRDRQDAEELNQTVRKSFEEGRVTRGAPNKIPEQVSLNLQASVPMLMDSVASPPESPSEMEEESEQRPVEEAPAQELYEPREPEIGSLEGTLDDEEDHPGVSTRESASPEPQATKRQTANPEPAKPQPAAAKSQSPQQSDDAEQGAGVEPDEVLIINVMAKSGDRFQGRDLLNALMAVGLKFGNMDIFHRHRDDDGDGPVLFSLANMVVPGTFNLAEMDGFETPGVSLFLSLPVAGESLAAYNDLAETAKGLAHRLGGELKDENRSVMTQQTIEHGRQRVIEYERKRKLARV